MFPWLFNVHADAVMKKIKMGMERIEMRYLEEGKAWNLPTFLHVDDLVLCSKSEEDPKVRVGRFIDLGTEKGPES